ncbi:MAG: leucine-rich repeat domain-containing protein [Alistipes sp.]|nr:leucine-rich repeat domain-containing protein [Alistipes sp.]
MKKFFLMLVVALCSVSCEFIGSIVDELKGSHSDNMIYLSFEQFSDLEVDQMAWRDSDEVSVFYNNSGNSLWEIDEIDEGVGTFVEQRVVEGVEELDCVVVAYPYSDDYAVVAAEQNLYATIPAIQSNTDIHRLLIASGEGDEFTLKNVCGRLNLKVTGEKKVVKMTLRSDDDVQIAGRVAINYVDYTLSLITDGSLTEEQCVREVTLDLGDGVQLSDTPTDFYFVIAQQTLPSSMTVTLTYEDGTTGTIKVRRLTGPIIQLPIEGVVIPGAGDGNGDDNTGGDDNQGGDDNTGDVIVNNDVNKIYYTSSDGNIITPKYNRFGANIISNTYENGVGVIVFDGVVSQIGNDVFYQRNNLTSIALPRSITFIGECAFQRCDRLVNITIPNSVTSIGKSAFQRCTALESVTLSENLTAIEYNTFCDCSALKSITIPGSVERIGENAFDSCSALVELEICNGVEVIDFAAFMECSSLPSIVIPNSVKQIGESAFHHCSKLEKITLGDGVETIEDSAFSWCFALTTITIPNSVTKLGERIFYNCRELAEFNGKFASDDKRCLIVDRVLVAFAPATLTEYTIPEGVLVVGKSAFCETSLHKVVIPKNVMGIDGRAFEMCKQLTSVTIGRDVEILGEYAFSACSALSEITIPASMTSIKRGVFDGCTSLKSVYCIPVAPPEADNSIFDNNASERKIYVYRTSVDDYKAASGWSKYADSIVGYDF